MRSRPSNSDEGALHGRQAVVLRAWRLARREGTRVLRGTVRLEVRARAVRGGVCDHGAEAARRGCTAATPEPAHTCSSRWTTWRRRLSACGRSGATSRRWTSAERRRGPRGSAASGSAVMIRARPSDCISRHSPESGAYGPRRASSRARIPGKRVIRYEVPLASDGGGVDWRLVEEFDTANPVVDGLDDDYFTTIVTDFLASNRGSEGMIGSAPSLLADAAAITAFAVDWLETPSPWTGAKRARDERENRGQADLERRHRAPDGAPTLIAPATDLGRADIASDMCGVRPGPVGRRALARSADRGGECGSWRRWSSSWAAYRWCSSDRRTRSAEISCCGCRTWVVRPSRRCRCSSASPPPAPSRQL